MDEMNHESQQEEEKTLTPDAGSGNAAPAEQEAPAESGQQAEQKPEPTKKTGMSAGKIAVLAALIVVAVAVVAALIWNGTKAPDGGTETTAPAAQQSEPAETTEPTIPADGNPDDVTCKGTYYVEDDDLASALDVVVATAGGQELTNRQLQVYYWMSFYDFLDMYGDYISAFGLDPTAPLDMQKSIQEGQTWQQFILNGALENWRNYTALTLNAEGETFEMDPKVTEFLEKLPEDLAKNAEANGFESVEEMIRSDMGAGADLDVYMSYMTNFNQGDQYYRSILKKISDTLTDEAVDAYFEEHAQTYAEKGLTKETLFVDARHILLTPEGGTLGEDGRTKTFTDEAWEACRVKAQALLDQFLAGEQTEEAFAALATENTQDPGSKGTGGLYKDMYEGQMVPPFEEWCFDDARAYGDTGLVKTDYGYHIMYFVGSRPAWIESAKADLITDQGREKLDELIEATDLQVDYSAIVLGRVDLNNTK